MLDLLETCNNSEHEVNCREFNSAVWKYYIASNFDFLKRELSRPDNLSLIGLGSCSDGVVSLWENTPGLTTSELSENPSN